MSVVQRITLHRDTLAYTGKAAQADTLTLIHGWGAENSVWADWAQSLTSQVNIVMIELPGFGQSPEFKKLENEEIEAAWMDALAAALPEKSHLLGWSLGGLLAQKLALAYPNQIQSLTCMASTPRFVQNDGWTKAISPSLLGDFIKMLGIEYGSVLKQFWRLQLQGSDNARPLMRKLGNHMSQRSLPHYSGLLQGLILLRDLDNRADMPSLKQPTLWLQGENDPLIPVELIEELSALQPNANIEILTGAGHMPFFSHPDASKTAIVTFLNALKENVA